MGFDFKKNEKLNKVITIVLIGILILIAVMPLKSSLGSETDEAMNENEFEAAYDLYASYYEGKLKQILENSYGEGTMQVMVQLTQEEQSDGIYGTSEQQVKVDGVLIVADVDNEQAVSDITFAVCALFDLPAHKVAVMIKK